MSKAILYIGKSGSGKSTAMRNLDPKTTFIIRCLNKELPWKGSERQYTEFSNSNPTGNLITTSSHRRIVDCLKFISKERPNIKDICIDDNTFITSLELLRRGNETTWTRFIDIANNFIELASEAQSLRNDLIVHILHHEDTIGDGLLEDFNYKAQSYGKLIDEKLGSMEAQFTIVLRATKVNSDTGLDYQFKTRELNSTTKSPMGMFEEDSIPNDIAEVSRIVREYYN